jgi:MoaA/NifB/PqqE/SkfB family radical SAM enzyme
MQTNGVLLSHKKDLDQLFKNGLDVIHFAFQSHKEETYKRLANSKIRNSFKKTVKAINNSISLGRPTHLMHVINSLNYRELPRFVVFVKKNFKGICAINFPFCSPSGNAWKNKWIVPSLSDVEPYVYKAIDYCKKNNILLFVSEGYPLCHLKGYEEYSAIVHLLIKRKVLIDDFITAPSVFNAEDITKDKLWKAEQCKKCSLNHICGGVWPNYKKIYGTEELKPSHKSLKKVVKKITYFVKKSKI